MAGHSKWSNIKHRKKRQDKKRAKLFAKLVREITVEAKRNPDPDENPTLASTIERAKQANMPKENIEKAIKRATGELEDIDYEAYLYEGYGPGGAAVLIHAITDNRNRTSTQLKSIFSRYGGELGENGCVRWMFDRKGVISVKVNQLNGHDLQSLQLEAIEEGIDNIEETDEGLIFYCPPEQLNPLIQRLRDKVDFLEQELIMRPSNLISLDAEKTDKVSRLIEELEANEDVNEVFTNVDL